MRRTIITFVGCAAMLVASPDAGAEPYRPQVGQRHPDFALPTISDGKPISLSQYRGQKVLLIQFASW
jgi:hypothetical protein